MAILYHTRRQINSKKEFLFFHSNFFLLATVKQKKPATLVTLNVNSRRQYSLEFFYVIFLRISFIKVEKGKQLNAVNLLKIEASSDMKEIYFLEVEMFLNFFFLGWLDSCLLKMLASENKNYIQV